MGPIVDLAMKKLLSAASFLLSALLIAVLLRTNVPASPRSVQGAQAGQGLEGRVATLESELMAERKRHDETRALLEQTLVYLDTQAKAAEALLTTLQESEDQGFAVGENWRSRQTLLIGLRAYWGGWKAGLPKAPTNGKPTLPVRPARQ